MAAGGSDSITKLQSCSRLVLPQHRGSATKESSASEESEDHGSGDEGADGLLVSLASHDRLLQTPAVTLPTMSLFDPQNQYDPAASSSTAQVRQKVSQPVELTPPKCEAKGDRAQYLLRPGCTSTKQRLWKTIVSCV